MPPGGSASNGHVDSEPGLEETGPRMGFLWMGKDTLKVPLSLFAKNRRKLLAKLRGAIQQAPEMADGGPYVVLLQGGETTTRYCSDTENVFRQESYFQYLFGVTEPDFYGALDVATGLVSLFMPRLPDAYAVWMGALLQPQDFKAKYQVDSVYYVDEMAHRLAEMRGSQGVEQGPETGPGRPTLLLLQGINTDSGNCCRAASFKGVEGFLQNSSILHPVLSECRVIKSEEELRVLRYSAAVSSDAHVQVMRLAAPGMMEYELESLFLHAAYAQGGCRHSAYTCICACGPNSSVLHYGHAAAPNDRQLKEGDMALLDMGAEYFCYGADITCSFPVNGKFTADQRMVYSAVLAAQKAVLGAMRPGVSWLDMHLLAERTLLEQLLAAGVVQGDVDAMMSCRLAAVFMPHGLGHFLGLDVHDVGGYNGDAAPRSDLPGLKSLRTTRTLQPGMLITVEPGCYFIDALLLPALENPTFSPFLVPERVQALRGTGGVRLEDDVIVTASGIENVTKCPREIEEVEAVMAGGPWPSAVTSLKG